MSGALLPLQSRVVETMRLRLGSAEWYEQNGKRKARITKLHEWRITSGDRAALEILAAIYQGEVVPWQKGGKGNAPSEGLFDLLTKSPVLHVAVNPELYNPVSQAFELWDGGGCSRRCDSKVDEISGKACLCRAAGKDPIVRDSGAPCKPVTRLSVWLWRTGKLGTARLETKGWNGALELPTSLALLPELEGHPGWRRGILRIDHRRSVKDGETRQYVVPVLEVDTDAGDHVLGAGASSSVAIGRGSDRPALSAGAPRTPAVVEPRKATAMPAPPIPSAAERRRARVAETANASSDPMGSTAARRDPDDPPPPAAPPGQETLS